MYNFSIEFLKWIIIEFSLGIYIDEKLDTYTKDKLNPLSRTANLDLLRSEWLRIYGEESYINFSNLNVVPGGAINFNYSDASIDALRHSLTAGNLYITLIRDGVPFSAAETIAIEVGCLHEVFVSIPSGYSTEEDMKDTFMDLYNNYQGIQIAKSLTDRTESSLITALLTSSKDGIPLSNLVINPYTDMRINEPNEAFEASKVYSILTDLLAKLPLYPVRVDMWHKYANLFGAVISDIDKLNVKLSLVQNETALKSIITEITAIEFISSLSSEYRTDPLIQVLLNNNITEVVDATTHGPDKYPTKGVAYVTKTNLEYKDYFRSGFNSTDSSIVLICDETSGDISLKTEAGDDLLYGNKANNVLNGGNGSDELIGLDGNDVLTGGEGSDKLYGGQGDDWLGYTAASESSEDAKETGSIPFIEYSSSESIPEGNLYDGGTGTDHINGSYNKDTYVFRIGDGTDTIVTHGGFDTLSIEGVYTTKDLEGLDVSHTLDKSNVFFSRIGTDLVIQLKLQTNPTESLASNVAAISSQDSITIKNWFEPNAYDLLSQFSTKLGVVTITYSNGLPALTYSAQEITKIALIQQGSSDSDTLTSVAGYSSELYGNGQSDTLIGLGNGDKLYGGDGADILMDNRDLSKSSMAATSASSGQVLVGGTQQDTYYAQNGDIIYDEDFDGVISLSGVLLSGQQFTWNSQIQGFLNSSGNIIAQLVDLAATNTDGIAVEFAANKALQFVDSTGAVLKIVIPDQPSLSGNSSQFSQLYNAIKNSEGATTRDLLNGTFFGINFSQDKLVNYIDGTDKDDVVEGTNKYIDIISTGDGNDTITVRSYNGVRYSYKEGTSYNEQVYAGKGNDTIYQGSGLDYIYGQEGDDTLVINFAQEPAVFGYQSVLDGGAGSDTLSFERATYGISFTLADSHAYGSSPNAFGWTTAQMVEFGSFNTIPGFSSMPGMPVQYYSANKLLSLNGFENTTGSAYNDTIYGNYGANVIKGNGGSDHLYGMAGNDTLIGADAGDYLDGGADADTMIGGGGDDTYVVDNASDVVVELQGGGNDTVFAKVSYKLSDQVENGILDTDSIGASLEAGNTETSLYFNSSISHSGQKLIGGAKADKLYGVAGNNILQGGAGQDEYHASNGNIIVDQDGSGSVYFNGTLLSSAAAGCFSWNPALGVFNNKDYTVKVLDKVPSDPSTVLGYLQIMDNQGQSFKITMTDFDLYAKFKTCQSSGSSDAFGGVGLSYYGLNFKAESVITGTNNNDTLKGNGVAGRINGLAGADTITGSAISEIIDGGAGNDTIDGGGGTDVLIGGLNSDTLIIDSRDDRVIEKSTDAGTDTVIIKSTDGYTFSGESEGIEIVDFRPTYATASLDMSAITTATGTQTMIINDNTGLYVANTLIGSGRNDNINITEHNVNQTIDGLGGTNTLYIKDEAGITSSISIDQTGLNYYKSDGNHNYTRTANITNLNLMQNNLTVYSNASSLRYSSIVVTGGNSVMNMDTLRNNLFFKGLNSSATITGLDGNVYYQGTGTNKLVLTQQASNIGYVISSGGALDITAMGKVYNFQDLSGLSAATSRLDGSLLSVNDIDQGAVTYKLDTADSNRDRYLITDINTGSKLIINVAKNTKAAGSFTFGTNSGLPAYSLSDVLGMIDKSHQKTIVGTPFSDTLKGNGLSNDIWTNGGNDTVLTQYGVDNVHVRDGVGANSCILANTDTNISFDTLVQNAVGTRQDYSVKMISTADVAYDTFTKVGSSASAYNNYGLSIVLADGTTTNIFKKAGSSSKISIAGLDFDQALSAAQAEKQSTAYKSWADAGFAMYSIIKQRTGYEWKWLLSSPDTLRWYATSLASASTVETLWSDGNGVLGVNTNYDPFWSYYGFQKSMNSISTAVDGYSSRMNIGHSPDVLGAGNVMVNQLSYTIVDQKVLLKFKLGWDTFYYDGISVDTAYWAPTAQDTTLKGSVSLEAFAPNIDLSTVNMGSLYDYITAASVPAAGSSLSVSAPSTGSGSTSDSSMLATIYGLASSNTTQVGG